MSQLHRVVIKYREDSFSAVQTVTFGKAHTVTFDPFRIVWIGSDEGQFWLNLEKRYSGEEKYTVELISFESTPLDQSLSDYDRRNMDTVVEVLCRDGKKIPAIKHVRTFTGLGLKEAKAYVEDLWNKAERNRLRAEMGQDPIIDYGDIPF